MGAPCKARLSGSSTKSDLSEDFLLYANYHRVNQRARARACVSSRGTVLSSTAADFRTWGDVSARRRAEPN